MLGAADMLNALAGSLKKQHNDTCLHTWLLVCSRCACTSMSDIQSKGRKGINGLTCHAGACYMLQGVTWPVI